MSLFTETFTICGAELRVGNLAIELFSDAIVRIADKALEDLREHPQLNREPHKGKLTVTLSWDY